MRRSRWLTLVLIATTVASMVPLGGQFLVDRKIRLRSLIPADPPPAPVRVRVAGHHFVITGALVRAVQSDHLTLRAWAPTPTIQVRKPDGPAPVTIDVENLPRRMQLAASGPVAESPHGTTRTLRFAPQATRTLSFTDSSHGVTFAVLGDTGDSDTFTEALCLASRQGADFLLHTGDLIYRDEQIPHLEAMLSTAPLPVFLVRGNHDYRNTARLHMMRKLAPPYYTFHLGGLTAIILDNGTDYVPTLWSRSTQYHWLRALFSMPREGPLVVAMHIPPFDLQRPSQPEAMLDRAFAQQLMRDFSRAGVAAVFTGHIHASYRWERDGIPYVISGEGYNTPTSLHHMAWVQVRGEEVLIELRPIEQQTQH
jgi:predicted phosphodiesterase